jgi:hypothetical protein
MKQEEKGIASPAFTLDRSLFWVGAAPKDSDTDLSEEDGERMSDQVVGNQRGLKDHDDEKDEDLEDLDEDKGEDDDEKREVVDERDEDLDEEEETYRRRFADTKADRDEKARQLREAMIENAKLKALVSTSSDVNEEQLAKEIQEGIFSEVSQITESDPAKARRAAYDVVGKHIAKATKKAVELALSKVTSQRQQEAQQTTEQSKAMEVAKRRARIALKEVGLDQEKHYNFFEEEVTKQMERDPEWFQAVPPSEHYMRIASRVKHRIEKIRERREEHQREAGGQISASSRVNGRSQRPKDDGDDEGADTLSSAISTLSRRNQARGAKAFQLAHLQRR